MASNNNYIDFGTLCAITKNESELSTYFYKLSLAMEKVHDKGCFISSMNPKNIGYDVENDQFVFDVEKLESGKENQMVKGNIINYIRLLNGIDKYYNIDINKGYSSSGNSNNTIYYYHEYINNLDKLSGNDKGNAKSKVKSTPAGVMFSSVEDDNNNIETDYSKAAFVSVPAMFTMAGILIIIMLIIFFVIKG